MHGSSKKLGKSKLTIPVPFGLWCYTGLTSAHRQSARTICSDIISKRIMYLAQSIVDLQYIHAKDSWTTLWNKTITGHILQITFTRHSDNIAHVQDTPHTHECGWITFVPDEQTIRACSDWYSWSHSETMDGNPFVIVVTDWYLKYKRALTSAKTRATQISTVFVDHFIKPFGIPSYVLAANCQRLLELLFQWYAHSGVWEN